VADRIYNLEASCFRLGPDLEKHLETMEKQQATVFGSVYWAQADPQSRRGLLCSVRCIF